MRKKTKIKITIGVLMIVIAFLSIFNCITFNNLGENDVSLKVQDEINLKSPKKSGYWNLQFIHIDGNWSHTAGNYTWCSGDGSWNNPYIIENVTIDASNSPTGSGILINNSKNDYFFINNCTVYNAGIGYNDSGIKLENTNNGTITGSKCSHNGRFGIFLYNHCKNNTISGNTANENYNYGIYLFDDCDNNTISGNTINDNDYSGIRLYWYCSNYIISNNSVNYNEWDGIHLDISSYGIISGNTANYNRYGIHLYKSHSNIISGNILIGNDECIFELECEENIFENNTCIKGGFPSMLIIAIIYTAGGIGLSVVIIVLLLKKLRVSERT